MWQMVLAYIFVKGWIIDPDEHRFFYQSGEVVFLPSHYTKIVDVGIVVHTAMPFKCNCAGIGFMTWDLKEVGMG